MLRLRAEKLVELVNGNSSLHNALARFMKPSRNSALPDTYEHSMLWGMCTSCGGTHKRVAAQTSHSSRPDILPATEQHCGAWGWVPCAVLMTVPRWSYAAPCAGAARAIVSCPQEAEQVRDHEHFGVLYCSVCHLFRCVTCVNLRHRMVTRTPPKQRRSLTTMRMPVLVQVLVLVLALALALVRVRVQVLVLVLALPRVASLPVSALWPPSNRGPFFIAC